MVRDNRTNEQTTKQPGDPSASLLLTTEKAVFCKMFFHLFLLDIKQLKDFEYGLYFDAYKYG